MTTNAWLLAKMAELRLEFCMKSAEPRRLPLMEHLEPWPEQVGL